MYANHMPNSGSELVPLYIAENPAAPGISEGFSAPGAADQQGVQPELSGDSDTVLCGEAGIGDTSYPLRLRYL